MVSGRLSRRTWVMDNVCPVVWQCECRPLSSTNCLRWEDCSRHQFVECFERIRICSLRNRAVA
ncbi:hypothetical protein THER5_2018 [Bifidobacterium thermacidophilum subsp. thermacidophilum]|uniref:Uncharacterized protein n=1 Tax=Bifidobacterium thermacidophilum subsp. thermacidophilum TaxID=79262 RepID=A0A087E6G6_9BIFI|nr:hypothetical protein THER5_2018 [Bifidobacterium thermacidophilum subsp. thermacidophilum]